MAQQTSTLFKSGDEKSSSVPLGVIVGGSVAGIIIVCILIPMILVLACREVKNPSIIKIKQQSEAVLTLDDWKDSKIQGSTPSMEKYSMIIPQPKSGTAVKSVDAMLDNLAFQVSNRTPSVIDMSSGPSKEKSRQETGSRKQLVELSSKASAKGPSAVNNALKPPLADGKSMNSNARLDLANTPSKGVQMGSSMLPFYLDTYNQNRQGDFIVAGGQPSKSKRLPNDSTENPLAVAFSSKRSQDGLGPGSSVESSQNPASRMSPENMQAVGFEFASPAVAAGVSYETNIAPLLEETRSENSTVTVSSGTVQGNVLGKLLIKSGISHHV